MANPCQALTKKGVPCRSGAKHGERFCGPHLAATQTPAPKRRTTPPKRSQRTTAPPQPTVAPPTTYTVLYCHANQPNHGPFDDGYTTYHYHHHYRWNRPTYTAGFAPLGRT
jgi:hypothetical protein